MSEISQGSRATVRSGRTEGRRRKPTLIELLASVGLMTWRGANSPPDRAGRSQDAYRNQIVGADNGSGDAMFRSNSSVVSGSGAAYLRPASRGADR